MASTEPGKSWSVRKMTDSQANRSFSIRAFRYPEDYAPVITLWEAAGPGIHLGRSDELEEIGKKLTRDPDLFLVAVAEREIVGTVLGGFDGRRGMVYHLAVALE